MDTFSLRKLLDGIRRRYVRRETIRILSALDDRSLRDIGIHRGDIPAVVDAALASGASAPDPGSGQPARGTRCNSLIKEVAG